LQYINIGRFLTAKPIQIDRFWGFGHTYYGKKLKKIFSVLVLGLRKDHSTQALRKRKDESSLDKYQFKHLPLCPRFQDSGS